MDRNLFLEQICKIAESDVFGTLVAGAFGALFGAWGAQLAISRAQNKQALIGEINAVRSAHMLCFSIINRFLSMKRQNVVPMQTKYSEQRDNHAKIVEESKGRAGPVTINIQADLKTLPTVKVPTEALELLIFEKISIQGRALAATADLLGCYRRSEQCDRRAK